MYAKAILKVLVPPFNGRLQRDGTFSFAEKLGYDLVCWNSSIYFKAGPGDWKLTSLLLKDFAFAEVDL